MMGKCVNAQPGTADMAIVVELHARPTADYRKSAGLEGTVDQFGGISSQRLRKVLAVEEMLRVGMLAHDRAGHEAGTRMQSFFDRVIQA